MAQNTGKKTNKDDQVASSAPDASVTPKGVVGSEGKSVTVDVQAQVDAAVATAIEEIKKQHATEIAEIQLQALLLSLCLWAAMNQML